MMIDFALQGRTRGRHGQSRRHLSRGDDPLPPDHDDNDSRAARRSAACFGIGEGSELRQPLGVSIVGGLILSQALTLYTTPVVYMYLDRLSLARLSVRP